MNIKSLGSILPLKFYISIKHWHLKYENRKYIKYKVLKLMYKHIILIIEKLLFNKVLII